LGVGFQGQATLRQGICQISLPAGCEMCQRTPRPPLNRGPVGPGILTMPLPGGRPGSRGWLPLDDRVGLRAGQAGGLARRFRGMQCGRMSPTSDADPSGASRSGGSPSIGINAPRTPHRLPDSADLARSPASPSKASLAGGYTAAAMAGMVNMATQTPGRRTKVPLQNPEEIWGRGRKV